VERRRTPEWAIQVGIRYHLAGMSLRDASQFLEKSRVQRSHVSIHEWVHKADLQPISTVTADQLVVVEKKIRLHGQQFWLYGSIDPQSNAILHISLFPTATNRRHGGFWQSFIIGINSPSIDHSDAMDTKRYPAHDICNKHEILNMENMANLNSVAGKRYTLCAFPLKIRNGTGSPIRPVAILD